jgi:hypothetical protein
MMKSIVIVLAALTAAVVAVPTEANQARDPYPKGCEPAAYACATNPTNYSPGWQVCDVDGTWKVRLLVFGTLVSGLDADPVVVCWGLPAQHPLLLQPCQQEPLLHPVKNGIISGPCWPKKKAEGSKVLG